MKKVLIYVEGQTEETFVRDVLAPYFQSRLLLIPTLARTKRTKAGQTFKGGIVSYAQVRRDIRNLLGDRSAALVTTMMDYYGLPDDFPAMDSLPDAPPLINGSLTLNAPSEKISAPHASTLSLFCTSSRLSSWSSRRSWGGLFLRTEDMSRPSFKRLAGGHQR